MSFFERLNRSVAESRIGKYFRLEGSGARRERAGSKFTTELRAGLTTFVTMAYIISVNSLIVTDSGGTCVCNNGGNATDVGCFTDPGYADCLATLKLDMVTATAAIACFSTLLMGLFANLPIGLAPGMGLNAYFTYTVVGFHGSNKISYETAVAAVFIEGILFILLSLFGIRQWLARLIPQSIKIATGAGIGLYLAFIGFQSSAGIGLIGGDKATLVALAGCVKDGTGACIEGTQMRGPTTWMGIFGLVIIGVCLLFRVKGAVLVGIVTISILSWIRGTTFTYFPYSDAGNASFDYFKKVVTFHPIQTTIGKMDFQLNNSEVWIALITFLYVDIMDTTGTLYSMAKFGGYMYKNGDFDGSTAAFLCDATSIVVGAVFGVPPVTAFIESGAGITEGGRTGLTSITTAFFFFISLFFSPIFASFPPWATGPALIVVGSMMVKSVRSINWDYVGDAIPAFLTIALMPLSYSIAYGLIAGVGSYAAINGIVYILELISGGRISPEDKDLKEPWISESFTWQNVLPGWIQKLICKMRGEIYVDPLDVIEEEERLEREAAAAAEEHESKIDMGGHHEIHKY
ncbi:nucleoside transporter [Lobosporangium transversale]|uniref:Nucleoside transporter n=1 Tax=Lobosporangium transversale TaxID=64571 RepID=A0A1Y2H1N8_9FUNG|nr:nucleoside transporter [Lobosporangium transversale]ORZ27911.1 nucleoside transporter [Lobosporangium transversale]|eukprot:XP_021885614.1 nucleoside transporter [Lobosporangium transversale]